jgi:hypothetical protein
LTGPGRFIAARGGAAWQVTPCIAGTEIDRTGFASDGWRGKDREEPGKAWA